MKRALENLRLSFQTQFSYLQAVEVTRRRLWLRALWLFLGLCLLLSARPAPGANTLLYEGFEGNFPYDNGWSVGNFNTNGAPTYWGKVNWSFGGEAAAEGSWKGYCAASAYPFDSSEPNPMYQDYMTSYMSKSINLKGYEFATLTFWHKIPSIE